MWDGYRDGNKSKTQEMSTFTVCIANVSSHHACACESGVSYSMCVRLCRFLAYTFTIL